MSAAAAIVLRRKKLVRRFADLGATSGDKAIPFEEAGLRRSWIFDQMVSRGVFVSVADDRFYMNEEVAREFLEAQRRRVLIRALLLLVVLVIVLLAAAVR